MDAHLNWSSGYITPFTTSWPWVRHSGRSARAEDLTSEPHCSLLPKQLLELNPMPRVYFLVETCKLILLQLLIDAHGGTIKNPEGRLFLFWETNESSHVTLTNTILTRSEQNTQPLRRGTQSFLIDEVSCQIMLNKHNDVKQIHFPKKAEMILFISVIYCTYCTHSRPQKQWTT